MTLEESISQTLPSTIVGYWLLAAFVVFLLLAGRKIYDVINDALEKSTSSVAIRVHEVQARHDKAQRKLVNYKHSFNELVAKCHLLQDEADKLIAESTLIAEKRLEDLERESARNLDARLRQLEVFYLEDTHQRLVALCYESIKDLMVSSDKCLPESTLFVLSKQLEIAKDRIQGSNDLL